MTPEKQAALKRAPQEGDPHNTYNAETGEACVSPLRAQAIAAVSAHYTALFGRRRLSCSTLRKAYAIPANTIKDPERQRMMNAFFFWAAWSCATERPGGSDHLLRTTGRPSR